MEQDRYDAGCVPMLNTQWKVGIVNFMIFDATVLFGILAIER